MSFLAETFVFDGHSCEEFGLMLGYIGQGGDDSSKFASGPTIVEQQVNRLWKPYFYGVTRPNKLTFQMQLVMAPCVTVNGVSTERDSDAFLSRQQIADVTRWLTSPNSYRWLEIIQPDMYDDSAVVKPLYRYRCMITELELNFINDKPCGFAATVTCDSPYAYLPEARTEIDLRANESVSLQVTNQSTMEQLYYPFIQIRFARGAGNISIENTTTGQILTFNNLPTDIVRINIDNERRILTSDTNANLYSYCNFGFIGLARGQNDIIFTNGSLESDVRAAIICNYPVDIGC